MGHLRQPATPVLRRQICHLPVSHARPMGTEGGKQLLPAFLATMVDSALRLPATLERKLSGGSRSGEVQTTARDFLRAMTTVSRRNSRREEEEEWEGSFQGVVREMEGVVDREGLVELITCPCGHLCLPPVSQCRKGHIYCRDCWASNSRTCPRCKQTLVEGTNPALDRLMAMVALPCRYKGCQDTLFLHRKAEHEEGCSRRPLPCQNSTRGCKAMHPAKVRRYDFSVLCSFNSL